MDPATHPLQAQAQRGADELLAGLDGAQAVVVCTSDGFPLGHAQRRALDIDHLAAVACSIGALGDTASHETGIGEARCVLVDSNQGRLLVRSVRRGPHALTLAVLTDASVVLGLVWAKLREGEQRLLEDTP